MHHAARPHAIWDFNGTLLDDNRPRLAALNESLAVLDLKPIDMDTYRANYCVPVPRFYGRLMGRMPSAHEWQLMDDVYQAAYLRHMPTTAHVMADARQALLTWQASGGTQSVLSLHQHDQLLADLTRYRLGSFFRAKQGRTGPTGGTKAALMRRHVRDLRLDPQHLVAVGDSADDALAARAAGVSVVLFAGGSHHRDALVKTGAPVADSLLEAIAVARELVNKAQLSSARVPA
ncbi:HAD hydrolase-like protein [Kitasatospora sp. GP82]|uniref:HAD family hydrolase n=1 Tax=Kitasatospora sp. GP82 TaxID=3035089 RepID=UPI002475F77A|nr:HAD hydrolase-like protein [Kitasatospora sp. GP82]MDH6129949.1 phosphoglycolate phosphatase-like HAD superfamily hydrolase [Kitasatospora sp. GP82]